jgi:hypothetical protein
MYLIQIQSKLIKFKYNLILKYYLNNINTSEKVA